MSCCTSSCSLPWKVSTRFPCSIRTPLFIFFYQAVFPYWLLLSTINVSLSRLNFYFNAASVHGRSCRPSVESADCIEIPPASERVFLEIPSSCLIAKTTQPVTSYIYIIKSYNYIYIYVCVYIVYVYINIRVLCTACLLYMSTPPGGRAALACPTLRCGPVPMRVTLHGVAFSWNPWLMGVFNMVQAIYSIHILYTNYIYG